MQIKVTIYHIPFHNSLLLLICRHIQQISTILPSQGLLPECTKCCNGLWLWVVELAVLHKLEDTSNHSIPYRHGPTTTKCNKSWKFCSDLHWCHGCYKQMLDTGVSMMVPCLLHHNVIWTGDVSDVLHQRYYRSCSTPFSLYLLAVANQHKILMLMEFGLTCLVIEQVI